MFRLALPEHRHARWLRVVLLVASACVGVGWLGAGLAMPPYQAIPLVPVAGLALACALSLGAPGIVGAALGAALFNVFFGALRGPLSEVPPGWAAACMTGVAVVGAVAQTALGAGLVRRFVRQPLALREPRDAVRFLLLAGPVACTVSASLTMAALCMLGIAPEEGWWAPWSLWWAGDTMGVMIGAPVALTLIGKPREDWAPRRLGVGVPLAVLAGLLTLLLHQVTQWEEQRLADTFERDALNASHDVATRMELPVAALEAVRGVLTVDPAVPPQMFQIAVQPWLLPGGPLQAVGHSVWMKRKHLPAFEQVQRVLLGLPDYRVHDRPDAVVDPAPESPAMAARLIEPLSLNRSALGVNPLSFAPMGEAIERARRTGVAVVTSGLRVVQDQQDRTVVVIFRALYRGAPTTMQERLDQMAGVGFAILRPDVLLAESRESLPKYLRLCLLDADPTATRRLLAGPDSCATAPPPATPHLRRITNVAFAGRQWDLQISAARADLPGSNGASAWLFAAGGPLGVALVAALLLTLSSRSRRIHALVAERTEELQRQIEDRRKTELALRETEHRLRTIFDNIPIGLRYTDRQGNLLEVNPAYCEITGYTVEELHKLDFWKLTHPDDRQADVGGFPALLRGEITVLERQKRYVRKSGEIRWVRLSVRLLGDPADPNGKTVGVVQDITDQFMFQEGERARKAAEAANRAKSEFLSRMSHELRTPLNAILGFAQLMEMDRKQPLPPQLAQWNTQLQKAGWHLLQMIDDVLDLSRIDTGNVKLQIGPLNAAAVLTETRSLVAQAAARRNVEVFESLGPRGARVLGDPTRVKQILTNLMSNAVKYNNPNGSIRVAIREHSADMLAFCVSDTGMGMTPEQMGNLFQPFNRLGRETSGVEGNGIGLVIARRLAEQMGGSLTATSEPGVGSTFTLLLPRAEAAHVEAAATLPLALGEAGYRARRVHYIEDNEVNAEVMRGVLAQRPQVTLNVSMTGREGVDAVREHPPSLILLDMHLPDMDGLQILKELQRTAHTASIPVVVVSADATEESVTAAMRAGATHVLPKPVNIPELLQVLDEHLEAQPTLFG